MEEIQFENIKAKEIYEKCKAHKDKLEELKNIAQPLVNYLQNNYDPHTYILVRDDKVEILQEEMGVPFEVKD